MNRRRLSAFALVRVVVVASIVIVFAWGLAHPALAAVFVGIFVAVSLYGFVSRSFARDAVYAAATRDLDRNPPLPLHAVNAPRLLAARPLQELALGVDRVRRGDVRGAHDAIVAIDESTLQADEVRMLGAVRALVAHAEHDRKGAAMLAVAAFPTGALEIDAQIAPLCIEAAWPDGVRLAALVDAWRSRGIAEDDSTVLGRYLRFALVKLGRVAPEDLRDEERRELGQLAHVFGDLETERRAQGSVPSSMSYR